MASWARCNRIDSSLPHFAWMPQATLLWRNLRDLMAAARREPVLITWYGAATAVLEPVPSGSPLELEP